MTTFSLPVDSAAALTAQKNPAAPPPMTINVCCLIICCLIICCLIVCGLWFVVWCLFMIIDL